jgi:ABC-2 type transport system permease protein
MSTAATRTTAASRSVALPAPGVGARLFGLGSIFGKTFRDSRRAALTVGIVMAVILLATAASVAAEFDTAEKRLAIAAQLGSLPAIFQGMLGEMISIEHLGGFISWRTVNFFPIILGIWTIVAMAGLLAGELARGSMDLLATTPRTRVRIALQKLGGYLLALALAVVLFAFGTYGALAAFGTLPGDQVGLDAVLGHSVWLFLMALVPGAVAFAVAPFLGRGGALGVAGVTLFASFIVSGYSSTVTALEPLRPLSFFAITEAHRPLAGVSDWPAVGVITAAAVALLVIGLVGFVRRDLLVPTGGAIRVPTLPIFLTGPFTRALGERMPASVFWGGALALFGAIIGMSVDEFVKTLSSIPELVDLISRVFPDADILSAGGFLQLAFFSEAILFVSIATATLVGGWASDEGDRRLELLLSVPVTRVGWAVRSGLAVMVGIAIITVIMVAGVLVGTATQAASRDLLQLGAGVSVLGLYAMAIAGIGLAVGGLVRPSLAAPVALIVALAFFLWELIGSIAQFPDEILDLALQRHLGQPILGQYDWPGMAACALLAFGGIALCAIGMRRRDIGR